MKRLFLIPIPAIVIGSWAMYINGLSIIIWGQNIFGLTIAVILAYLVVKKPKIIESVYTIPAAILLLLLTFLDSGLKGVHRWVTIGPIKLYIASIVVPVLIFGLWRSLKASNWRMPTFITIGVALLLALQPDASQTTAFVISMAIIIFPNLNKNSVRYILGIFSSIIVFVWIYLDNLPPVAYVEGIVKMVAGMGVGWLILGVASLIILPLPFILFPSRKNRLLSIGLGTYFITVLTSSLFGNFPVPLMGYGISPIIGYYIAIACLINTKAYP